MISNDEKKRLIEELTKTPFISAACKNIGISKASFYRWKEEDPWFAEQVAFALQIGRGPINDRAESVVIKQINQNNFAAAKWWLTIHHEDYRKLTREEKEQKKPGLVNYLKDLIIRRERKESNGSST